LLSHDLAPVIGTLAGIVLDVGGGRPAFHDNFWNGQTRRIRVDLSPSFRPDVVGDVVALPFHTGSVDTVVMCELLEHIAEPYLAVAEAHRVLRPGGTLLGSTPFIMVMHSDPADFARYTAEGLRRLLRDFSTKTIIPHGNHVGASWRLMATRFRLLLVFNPLFRLLSRWQDDRCPEGYTFVALKRGSSEDVQLHSTYYRSEVRWERHCP
jgi:SAM-dependent methyltransferase